MATDAILGIDPGLAACGWAIVSGERLLASGVVRTRPTDGSETDRQAMICAAVMQALRECPEAVTLAGVETQHAQGGDLKTQRARAAAAMAVAFVRGGLTGELRARGVPVVEVSPQEGKRALTGRGDATKEQMVAMAEARFGARLAEHAADACGVALAAAQVLAGRQTRGQKRGVRREALAGLPERVREAVEKAEVR